MELSRIAGDNANVTDGHAELFRNDLREGSEVALSLRAVAGADIHLTARLDLHAGAFVRTDAGGLDKRNDRDTDMLALGAQAQLFLLYESLVINHLERFLKNGFVISAIKNQLGERLVNDHVVIRERLRRDEILPADFKRVNAQFPGGDIQHSLDNKDSLLSPCASHGSDNGFVRKNGRAIRREILDHVPPHQVTLRIKRDGQAIGIERARIVQEIILQAQDASVFGKCRLDIVQLLTFRGGGVEILAPVFDPFDGTA